MTFYFLFCFDRVRVSSDPQVATKRKIACCRDEATRTPDPYVPNVVRYQLRYIPIALRDSLQKPAYFQKSECKGSAFLWIKQIFQEKVMICQIFVVPLHTDKKMVP